MVCHSSAANHRAAPAAVARTPDPRRAARQRYCRRASTHSFGHFPQWLALGRPLGRPWAIRAAAATFGALDAPFNRSATEGIRLAEISDRICSISAHLSRWPTPISGFRAACFNRSLPASANSRAAGRWCVPRRPDARSAGEFQAGRVLPATSLAVACSSHRVAARGRELRAIADAISPVAR